MTLTTRVLLCLTAIIFTTFGDVQAECSPSFFAKGMKYEDAVEIDFYYTGINLASAKACASFCSQREFCRSAVYNSRTKTCGISYQQTVACLSNLQRFNDFKLPELNNGDLIQIACIEECKNNDGTKNQVDAERIPVGIITGEPNDGDKKSAKTPENAKENVITDPLNIEKPRAQGYVTRLILANISGAPLDGVGSVEPLTLQQNDGNVKKQAKNQGKSQVCYRTIRHRYLLGATFEEHDVKTINECRCLCAATYKHGIYKCQSFQYKAGKCELNKGNHLGQFDLIEKRKSFYQFVDCNIEVLLDVASNFCEIFKNSSLSASTTEKPKVELVTAASIPNENESDLKTTKSVKISKKSDNKGNEKPKTSTTQKPTTTKKTTKTTTTTIKPKTTTKGKTTQVAKSTAATTATTEIPKTTSTIAENKKETSATASENRPIGNDGVEEILDIKKIGCFETIDDHLMVSVAGGLEHDISLEECQCICANSKKSGRYEFQCRSATYYHVERDCILNLEDRFMKPKLFESQLVNFNVSYIGIACDIEKTMESTSLLAEKNCKFGGGSPSSAPKKRKHGINTDDCYVELNDFVLEGTAIAVETAASPKECKCKCAQGEKLYGEECASFLYYYDSKTCLISKQNRFSNPEKFNFVPSVNQSRSYFEWTCANKDEARVKYLAETCNISSEKIDGNLLNSEGDTVFVKQDEHQDVRLKRLDEKEFLKKIETIATDDSMEESTTKTPEKVNDSKVVGTRKETEESLLRRIEEAAEILEAQSSTEPTTTSTKNVITTTTEKVTTTTKQIEKESKVQATNEKVVKTRKVDEEEINERLSQVVDTSNDEPETTTPATTTTAKLVINDKKNAVAKKSKIENTNTDVPTMRKVDDMVFERLMKEKIDESPDLEQLNQVDAAIKDPNLVRIKKVEEEILTKLSQMEVDKSGAVDTPLFESSSTKSSEKTSPKSKPSTPSRYNIPEAEGFDDEDDSTVTSEMSDEGTTTTEEVTTPQTTTEEITTTTKAKASGVKTHKFDEKVEKGMPPPRLSTTTEATTTTAGYPPAGRCSYSALYQTAFLGRRLLKTVRVKTPADCFAACYALRCRSANLIAQGEFNSCELYRDSLIDYRRPDMLGYDASTVYFDGINCDGNN